MWRFWNQLPAAGDWAIFDRSWYRRVLEDYLDGTIDKQQAAQARDDIRQFEQGLVDSGAVVVKFWLHISKHEQKKRFEKLQGSPSTAWRVGKVERRQHQRYDEWSQAVEVMLARTSSAAAPWTVVEATQRRFARLSIFRTLAARVREALNAHLPAGGAQGAKAGGAAVTTIQPPSESAGRGKRSGQSLAAASRGPGGDHRRRRPGREDSGPRRPGPRAGPGGL